MNSLLNKLFLDFSKSDKFKYFDFDESIFFILNSFFESKKTIFLTLPKIQDASKYFLKLSEIIPDNILFYPLDSYLTIFTSLASGDFLYERLNTVEKLLKNDKNYIVVTTYDSLLKYQMPFDIFKSGIINFKKGNLYQRDDIKNKLTNIGYKFSYIVNSPGEFSFRGEILDIYPLNFKNPVRIDFFDNLVEDIKEFDLNTQISNEKVDDIFIFPTNELIYDDSLKLEFIKKIREYFSNFKLSQKEEEKLEEDYKKIQDHKHLESLLIYYKIIFEKPQTLLDIIKSKLVYKINLDNLFIDLEEKSCIDFLKADLDGKNLTSLSIKKDFTDIKDEIISLNLAKNKKELNISIDDFLTNLKTKWIKYNIFIDYEKELDKESFIINLKKIKLDDSLDKKIYFLNNNYNINFVDDSNKIVYLSLNKLLNKDKKTSYKYRSIVNQTTKIYKPDEIKKGDYVVHYEQGIGRYIGLKTLNTTGVERDYLLIKYANDENLYVPIEQIDFLLKYHKDPSQNIRLSSLGSPSFKNLKLKTKKKIKDYYDYLLLVYNIRNKTSGYSFYENTELENELKDDFKFEETKDQKKAIDDVLNDMKKQTPMERLICGDVGFGKTEVAIRASFRCCLNSKQVALISPTTILAKQHYETFKKRLEKFGVRVELLTRFTKTTQKNKILNDLKIGLVDILIGSHKILGKNVLFKNLGLLVVDEEQKFGVIAKEKIKEKNPNIDCLYLSATPIPRTLKMGLSKLKDLSIIQTPPKNRFPIQTYLLKYNILVVKDAIVKELARGGQIFYLVSKIADIEKIKKELEKIPDVKISILHGRLEKDEIYNVLDDFISGKSNLLLTTTIIENGIDIPNANTLIVHDSNNFGLSQLYQIKGRIGRSDKIGYAYFLADDFLKISPDAKKRLDAIKEYNMLGSGYEIAMQDLLIRGSGDLLGSNQSGFIESVGLMMYLRLVDEEVNNLPEPVKVDNKFYSTHIKEEYIENEDIRIEIHKKIKDITSYSDIISLENELVDRFGKMHYTLKLYMQETLYKKNCEILKIIKTEPSKNSLKLTISLDNNQIFIFDKFIDILNMKKIMFSIKIYENNHIINLNLENDLRNWLYIINEIIMDYLN